MRCLQSTIAAGKVIPPVSLCGPTMSEMDVGAQQLRLNLPAKVLLYFVAMVGGVFILILIAREYLYLFTIETQVNSCPVFSCCKRTN